MAYYLANVRILKKKNYMRRTPTSSAMRNNLASADESLLQPIKGKTVSEVGRTILPKWCSGLKF